MVKLKFKKLKTGLYRCKLCSLEYESDELSAHANTHKRNAYMIDIK